MRKEIQKKNENLVSYVLGTVMMNCIVRGYSLILNKFMSNASVLEEYRRNMVKQGQFFISI